MSAKSNNVEVSLRRIRTVDTCAPKDEIIGPLSATNVSSPKEPIRIKGFCRSCVVVEVSRKHPRAFDQDLAFITVHQLRLYAWPSWTNAPLVKLIRVSWNTLEENKDLDIYLPLEYPGRRFPW